MIELLNNIGQMACLIAMAICVFKGNTDLLIFDSALFIAFEIRNKE